MRNTSYEKDLRWAHAGALHNLRWRLAMNRRNTGLRRDLCIFVPHPLQLLHPLGLGGVQSFQFCFSLLHAFHLLCPLRENKLLVTRALVRLVRPLPLSRDDQPLPRNPKSLSRRLRPRYITLKGQDT